MPPLDSIWINFAVALGIGLLVGAERERRKAEGSSREPAGVRTFTAVSLLGAAGMMIGGALVVAATAVCVATLLGIAYWRNVEQEPGLTTEVAVLLTLLLGALTLRDPALAAGLGVALALLLAAREPLHRFIRTMLTERELADFLVLAAASLVVLPIIPNRYVGPFDAINPHVLWLIVVLVMAIGAAGHVALRILGSHYGLPVVGFFSGFVSSTATIAAMGERCRDAPALLRPAAAGAVLSTVATIVLMAVLLGATSVTALVALAVPLACAGAAAVLYGAVFVLKSLRAEKSPSADAGRAFSMRTALVLAATMAVVLLAAAALERRFGAAGLVAAASIAGFADVHAAVVSTVALVASGKLEPAGAALPILAALSTNTISKITVAFASGGARYAAQVVPGLLLVVGAAWGGWLIG